MTSLIKLLWFKIMWGAAGVDAPRATVASAIAAAADEGGQGIGYSPIGEIAAHRQARCLPVARGASRARKPQARVVISREGRS